MIDRRFNLGSLFIVAYAFFNNVLAVLKFFFIKPLVHLCHNVAPYFSRRAAVVHIVR